MKRRILFVCSIAALVITGSFAFSRYAKGNIQSVPQNPKVTSPEYSPIADTVLYKHFFRHHEMLDKKAQEEEKIGKDGKVYREFYKRQAKLTDAQAKDLDQIAKETNKEVTRINSKAQEIIKAVRAIYPDGKLPIGQKPPLPPAILADLQEQHDTALEQARGKLKLALGDDNFAEFDGFLRRFMGPNIKVENKTDRIPPTSKIEKPVK